MVKHCVLGTGIGFASSGAILLLLAYVASGTADARALTTLFGMIIFFVGVFAASLSGGLLHAEMPMIGSILCTAVYVGILSTVSLALREADGAPIWHMLIRCGIGILIGAGIGLILNRRAGSSHKTRRKLHKKLRR